MSKAMYMFGCGRLERVFVEEKPLTWRRVGSRGYPTVFKKADGTLFDSPEACLDAERERLAQRVQRAEEAASESTIAAIAEDYRAKATASLKRARENLDYYSSQRQKYLDSLPAQTGTGASKP